MSTGGGVQQKKKQKPKKRTNKTGTDAAEKKNFATLDKQKGAAAAKQELAKLAENYNQQGLDALGQVYGAGKVKGQMLGELAFDSKVLSALAKSLSENAGSLTADNFDKKSAAYRHSLEALTERVEETRRIGEGMADLTAAALELKMNLAKEPLVSKQWKEIQELKGEDVRDGIDDVIEDVRARLDMISGVLAAINGVPGAAKAVKIPADLLAAAGANQPLKVLYDMTQLEPDRVKVEALLNGADLPKNVPNLLRTAKRLGADLGPVLAQCNRETHIAERLLKAIDDTGKNAKYFTNVGDTTSPEDGQGGMRLHDLWLAAMNQAPLWAGQGIQAGQVQYGSPDNRVDFDTVKARSFQQQPGQDVPANLADGNHFVGGSIFFNTGDKHGMVLPRFDHSTLRLIEYVKYDIRPYTNPIRGGERVVESNDGTRYYTNDHYQTFKRIT